jgi:hypothetical protein
MTCARRPRARSQKQPPGDRSTDCCSRRKGATLDPLGDGWLRLAFALGHASRRRRHESCNARRLSHKPKPLYGSDNGSFRRPHRTASGGRTGLSATEKAPSEIVALSWMHKKSMTPRVCATASADCRGTGGLPIGRPPSAAGACCAPGDERDWRRSRVETSVRAVAGYAFEGGTRVAAFDRQQKRDSTMGVHMVAPLLLERRCHRRRARDRNSGQALVRCSSGWPLPCRRCDRER